jgi:hypothetical protein
MNKYSMLFATVALIQPALNAGCYSTNIKNVWYDDSYGRGMSHVLVIGAALRPSVRRSFENEFARRLQARGSDAVPSHTILESPESMLDKEAVKAGIEGMDIDTVLVTTILDKKSVDVYHRPDRDYHDPRPYQEGWETYYRMAHTRMRSTGYTIEQKTYTLETRVFDRQTEKPIYSAVSKTVVELSSDDAIDSFIRVIVRDLAAKGLVGPRVQEPG